MDGVVQRLESTEVNIRELQRRVRQLEKQVETLWTPPWKRLWFWIDGWPLYRIVDATAKRRRPWDNWVTRRQATMNAERARGINAGRHVH